ncbi:MAG: HAD family phosphatase [Bacteroidota bacterium]|nr:HAD family phosphatase [Odoribacter sp.]MDP3180972.1 HAD family phosphatase [Bacteroidota bacterium]MDP3644850.1 HAD family phosphatase [Bacteroidota bacterium]
MTKTKAIIFDMDGTLVDSIPFHKDAWLSFLKKHDIILDPDQFQAQNHGNLGEMIRRFFGQDISDEKVEELGQEKEKIYRDLYKKHIKEIYGLTDLLNTMKKQDIKASLATMGDIPNIDFVLDELKIRPFFHSITGGHEILRGKPDAEIFKLSLKKMNFKNTECMVIEDSIGGVLSARKAGIKVIGITTSYSADELKRNGCFYTISNFKELDLDFVLQC